MLIGWWHKGKMKTNACTKYHASPSNNFKNVSDVENIGERLMLPVFETWHKHDSEIFCVRLNHFSSPLPHTSNVPTVSKSHKAKHILNLIMLVWLWLHTVLSQWENITSQNFPFSAGCVSFLLPVIFKFSPYISCPSVRVPTACSPPTLVWNIWSVRFVGTLTTSSATSTTGTWWPSSTCWPTSSWSCPEAGRWSTTTPARWAHPFIRGSQSHV